MGNASSNPFEVICCSGREHSGYAAEKARANRRIDTKPNNLSQPTNSPMNREQTMKTPQNKLNMIQQTSTECCSKNWNFKLSPAQSRSELCIHRKHSVWVEQHLADRRLATLMTFQDLQRDSNSASGDNESAKAKTNLNYQD